MITINNCRAQRINDTYSTSHDDINDIITVQDPIICTDIIQTMQQNLLIYPH